jgi:hypothetical protein
VQKIIERQQNPKMFFDEQYMLQELDRTEDKVYLDFAYNKPPRPTMHCPPMIASLCLKDTILFSLFEAKSREFKLAALQKQKERNESQENQVVSGRTALPLSVGFSIKSNFLIVRELYLEDIESTNDALVNLFELFKEIEAVSFNDIVSEDDVKDFLSVLRKVFSEVKISGLKMDICANLLFLLPLSFGLFDELVESSLVCLNNKDQKPVEIHCPSHWKTAFNNFGLSLECPSKNNEFDAFKLSGDLKIKRDLSPKLAYLDGYLFVFCGKVLAKVGTGCAGTVEGKVYLTIPLETESYNSWIAACGTKLYLRSSSALSRIQVLDSNTLDVRLCF